MIDSFDFEGNAAKPRNDYGLHDGARDAQTEARSQVLGDTILRRCQIVMDIDRKNVQEKMLRSRYVFRTNQSQNKEWMRSIR